MGVPPSKLPSGVRHHAVQLHRVQAVSPQGRLPGALQCAARLLPGRGGEARFNCAAAKILVEDGAVRGVLTEQGEQVGCRYVISNASTVQTYLELIDRSEVPEAALEPFKSSTIGPRPSPSTWASTASRPSWASRTPPTSSPRARTPTRPSPLWRTMEQQGWALLTCFDVADPDFSPPGTCQAALVALQYADPWYAVSPSSTPTPSPLCRGHGAASRAGLPGSAGTSGGTGGGHPAHPPALPRPSGRGDLRLDQNAYTQPFLTNRSPIKGLFFAGAWAGSGGFQPTLTSGRSTARSILRT